MFSMPEGLPDREPTKRDLAAIEAEWPLIEAGLAAVDAEIRSLLAADVADELDVRRARRARRRVLRIVPAVTVGRGPWGGEAA